MIKVEISTVLLAVVSLSVMILLFAIPGSSPVVIPLIAVVLGVRNPGSLFRYLRFLLPSAVVIFLFFLAARQPREGVGTVLLLSGSSLSLQLFLAFFPQKSLYLLLRQTGCPEKPAFIAYCTVNYSLMVKPVIIEIQDAQRLRGMEIPRGIRAIFHLKGILIPLMIRLLKGADHLAESLTLRGRDQ